jgi:hypothetical protein
MMQQDNSTSARETSPTNPVRAFLSATVPRLRHLAPSRILTRARCEGTAAEAVAQ